MRSRPERVAVSVSRDLTEASRFRPHNLDYTSGPITFAETQKVFSGTVAGIRAEIHYEGSTADELAQTLRDSIDFYVEWCLGRGKEPERPFKGQILVRTAPELHRKAALRAAEEGVSLSKWISRRIAEAA